MRSGASQTHAMWSCSLGVVLNTLPLFVHGSLRSPLEGLAVVPLPIARRMAGECRGSAETSQKTLGGGGGSTGYEPGGRYATL